MSDQRATKPTEGAVGAGIVLVLVPVAALVPGMDKISGDPIVGLPILAVFGIMILFGAMSLKAYAGVSNAGVTSNAATLESVLALQL